MTHLKELSILGLAIALALSVDGAASAISVGGSGAKAISSSDASCANYAYGFLSNSCSTTRSFMVPATISSSGTKSFSYHGYGATSSNNVGCKATAMISLTGGYTTPTIYLSQFGSVQSISLGSLSVDSTYPVYFNCSIDNGGELISATWDE